MEVFNEYFMEGFFIVTILVGILTQVVKKQTAENSKLKPIYIVLVLSLVLSIAHGTIILEFGFSSKAIITCVEQGILVAAIAMAGYDVTSSIVPTIKSLFDKEEKEEE